MKRVVVAGGIGAGKTAATTYLAEKGWPIVDADLIARKVVERGQPALAALVDAFGTAVLDGEGNLDRPFVADVVFHDATALKRLNRITHGAIAREMVSEVDAARGDAVFIAIPLYRVELRENLKIDESWSIQVSPETAVTRLTGPRGLREDDARARLAAQITNEERSAIADRVIWNEGTLEELHAAIDKALNGLGVA